MDLSQHLTAQLKGMDRRLPRPPAIPAPAAAPLRNTNRQRAEG
jgi:hypothetical protein